MSKLPSFRRIFKTDFQAEFQNMIETLSNNLNNGIEVLYDALNKKISLRDNIQCDVKDIEVTVSSTGIPKIATSFLLTNITKAEGLSVIRAMNLDNSSGFPTNGVFITFTQSTNNIIINHITGLVSDNRYSLRVVAFG